MSNYSSSKFQSQTVKRLGTFKGVVRNRRETSSQLRADFEVMAQVSGEPLNEEQFNALVKNPPQMTGALDSGEVWVPGEGTELLCAVRIELVTPPEGDQFHDLKASPTSRGISADVRDLFI